MDTDDDSRRFEEAFDGEPDDEFDGLLMASQSSLDFWGNPLDDEIGTNVILGERRGVSATCLSPLSRLCGRGDGGEGSSTSRLRCDARQ